MTTGPHRYNPLDRRALGRSVEQALLQSPCEPLPPPAPFEGAGLYALYHQGPFPAYQPISAPDCAVPIYVGRAVPRGARRGDVGLDEAPGRVLFDRLRQHANSIAAAENLEVTDFRCRYLIVDDIWVPLAEALLIGHFRPLWNGVVEGFGIHAPGAGRANQARSSWDTLHPGRRFATALPGDRVAAQIELHIAAHFAEHPPPTAPPPLSTSL
jgi:Eco29kI restriction endonuclease